MESCTYRYYDSDGKVHVFDSYTKLIEHLEKTVSLEDINDLIFSQGDLQTIRADKIEQIKAMNKNAPEFTTKGVSMMDGGVDIEAPKGDFTAQSFVDSPYYLVGGEPPMFKMNTEDYVRIMKKQWTTKGSLTEEEAEARGATIQARWDEIAENSKDFHRLMMLPPTDIAQEWVLRTRSTAFRTLSDQMHKAEKDIHYQVMKWNGKDHQGIRPNSRLIKNVHLQADLKGMDEKIFGHLDYVVVRDNGDIEIFLVKTSTEPFSQWSATKIEKYRHEAALLKRMLAANGVDTRYVRMNMIPVHIKYGGDLDTVEYIEVQDSEPLDKDNGRYIMKDYDQIAAQFIDADVDLSMIKSDYMQAVGTQLQHIFPGLNITAEGTTQTAKDWIERNWRYCNPKTLPEGGWELTIPETKEVIRVKDTRARSKNEELMGIITKKLRDSILQYSGSESAYFLRTDIENAFRSGVLAFNDRRGGSRKYLYDNFSKYFNDHKKAPDGTITYKWKLWSHDAFDKANLIVLRNSDTGQIDVFAISNSSPGAKFSFKGRKNLLGAYIPDMNKQRFMMEANFGNAEAIRVMAILNEILPDLGGDFKLGQLRVIGMNEFASQQGAFFEFHSLLPDWDQVIRVVNNNTPANIQNNIRASKVECIAPEEVLRQTWLEVINDEGIRDLAEIKGLSEIMDQHVNRDGTIEPGLLSISTTEGKIAKLEALLERLRTLADRNGVNYQNSHQLVNTTSDTDKTRAGIARLYMLTSQALSRYHGDSVTVDEKFSRIEALGLKTTSIGNTNVRRVGYLVQRSIDNMRARILDTYMPGAMEVFKEYYEDCGYSKIQNALINNQETLYRNLYQPDEKGENTFLLKNPYDPDSDLEDHERKFLKKILWEFYKVRCAMNGNTPEFSGYDDPKLPTKMPPNYLFVPLQRASTATKRLHLKDNLDAMGKRIHKLIARPGEVIDGRTKEEAVNEILEENQGFLSLEEAEQRDKDIADLRVYNRYKYTDSNLTARDRYISEKGAGYFETNMENIFIDFLSEQVRVDEFNRLLMRIKAIELALVVKGISEGDEKAIERTLKTIDDFITVNIFNKSIMEKAEQKIDAFLSPLRKMVSTFYVSANPVGAIRDTLQGLQENFFQAAIKYQTDVSVADVAFGYAMVFKDSLASMSQMSLLNQINIKNGFSNFDAAKVAERLKTGRGGVLNPEHWMYWTLRAPDYLNRMVLFVAKAHHDGVWQAYSLDENNRLKYNWRLDARFNQLAANNTNHPDYAKQKSLYYSLIRQFNMETGSELSYSDDLPDGYTPGQIRAIKTLGESIYGAYDNASKAMYENMAIGRNFAFFSTWMNGIVDNWAKARQISHSELSWEQETDYNGNKLFFEADGSGNTTTEDTGIPVYADVPIMVQGIIHTFGQFWNEMRGGASAQEAWHTILESDINRRNLKRGFGDMLVALIFAWMFKCFITPSYNKHKKEDDGHNVVANVAAEWLYKASYSSFDTFKGPLAVISYLGDSTNPATYKLQSKLANDAWNLVIGEKTLGQTIMGSQAMFRSMQDSYRMYMREERAAANAPADMSQ